MAQLRSIRHKLRRFAWMNARHRAFLVEAVLWLLLARLSLAVISFRRLSQRLGTFVSPTDPRVERKCSSCPRERMLIAEEISRAVRQAARHVPFRAVCLPQAMAARAMLRRRGVRGVIHFGAARGVQNRLEAHAWVDAAGIKVTGYPLPQGFTEIACLV